MDKLRITTLAGLSVAALLSTRVPSRAADLDCTAYMTGKWVGTGAAPGGIAMELQNIYSFTADGDFETINRYRAPGKEWSEQTVTGEWTAKPDTDAPQGCAVSMTSTDESGSATSVATYVRIDDETLSTMGFEMHREK
ncbi:hypothetical protein [Jiella sonneratiae]|uniref:DUF1579 domain-containing protein n=1 Tax=Jiella sonneratiae TaxID=2816856 RepID=A0ABS3J9I4_9HYPH|nr:hypothetical protein [Jiella sonneratiae]MBO0906336.1 hypothetical protein [Jiella sonneratiae]